jgi:hypothetical protein
LFAFEGESKRSSLFCSHRQAISIQILCPESDGIVDQARFDFLLAAVQRSFQMDLDILVCLGAPRMATD